MQIKRLHTENKELIYVQSEIDSKNDIELPG